MRTMEDLRHIIPKLDRESRLDVLLEGIYYLDADQLQTIIDCAETIIEAIRENQRKVFA